MDFLIGIQEHMVDALALKGDEGRGVAAISFGEVSSNLRSEDLRMGKPHRVNLYDRALILILIQFCFFEDFSRSKLELGAHPGK